MEQQRGHQTPRLLLLLKETILPLIVQQLAAATKHLSLSLRPIQVLHL